MEYINIISQEPIMTVPEWTFGISLLIPMGMILSSLIYLIVTKKNQDKTLKYLLSMFVIAIIWEITSICICDKFLQIPTGKYEYQATINKDKITVSQYEKFIEEYNPIIKDGVYYWTD